MKKPLIFFLAILSAFLTACGWQFKNSERFPEALRSLQFDSADPYSEMSRVLRSQLRAHDIELIENATAPVASLRLNNTTLQSRVASVFKQAREAEKILSLTVNASVNVPNKGNFPLEVSVFRTFFDDSRAALAKSQEQESIEKQMYEQAARQLLIKMVGLHQSLAATPAATNP